MKQFTTPLIQIQLVGAQDLLERADTVYLTARRGQNIVDKLAFVSGEIVSAEFTQEETALFLGTVDFEVTICVGESVYKSETVSSKFEPAVRQVMV